MDGDAVTSRQRLLGAMCRKPIDRVPVSTYELVGWNEASWENREPSYEALMKVIRENTDCIYMADVRWVHEGMSASAPMYESRTWQEDRSRYTKTVIHTPKGDLTSLHRTDEGVHTTWTLEHLLKSLDDIEKYLSVPWEPARVDMGEFYRTQDGLSEKGVMMLSVGDPICEAAELFEMGEFLVHAVTEPKAISYFLDAIHERQMHSLRQILANDVVGVQFRICGPEYATPPYLGPDGFRRYVFPYISEICEAVRSAGGFARVHCHGKIRRVLDQIADAGAQGLDPIEPPPDGDIGLHEVKVRYGKDLCLFGNIELKELENSDPGRIDELVRQAMEAAKDGGGFVLMPTAAPINVPLSPKTERNYMAYIEAALRYGCY